MQPKLALTLLFCWFVAAEGSILQVLALDAQRNLQEISGCSGSPCAIESHCRSSTTQECGSGPLFCNNFSLWNSTGCLNLEVPTVPSPVSNETAAEGSKVNAAAAAAGGVVATLAVVAGALLVRRRQRQKRSIPDTPWTADETANLERAYEFTKDFESLCQAVPTKTPAQIAVKLKSMLEPKTMLERASMMFLNAKANMGTLQRRARNTPSAMQSKALGQNDMFKNGGIGNGGFNYQSQQSPQTSGFPNQTYGQNQMPGYSSQMYSQKQTGGFPNNQMYSQNQGMYGQGQSFNQGSGFAGGAGGFPQQPQLQTETAQSTSTFTSKLTSLSPGIPTAMKNVTLSSFYPSTAINKVKNIPVPSVAFGSKKTEDSNTAPNMQNPGFPNGQANMQNQGNGFSNYPGNMQNQASNFASNPTNASTQMPGYSNYQMNPQTQASGFTNNQMNMQNQTSGNNNNQVSGYNNNQMNAQSQTTGYPNNQMSAQDASSPNQPFNQGSGYQDGYAQNQAAQAPNQSAKEQASLVSKLATLSPGVPAAVKNIKLNSLYPTTAINKIKNIPLPNVRPHQKDTAQETSMMPLTMPYDNSNAMQGQMQAQDQPNNYQQGNYQQGYQQGNYQQGNYQQGANQMSSYQQGNYQPTVNQQSNYQQGNYQQNAYQQNGYQPNTFQPSANNPVVGQRRIPQSSIASNVSSVSYGPPPPLPPLPPLPASGYQQGGNVNTPAFQPGQSSTMFGSSQNTTNYGAPQMPYATQRQTFSPYGAQSEYQNQYGGNMASNMQAPYIPRY